MAEEQPYTGEEIDRATGGYVNSGVLRMWVSEGWLTAGPRAKSIRGGPRTYHHKTVMKAVLMAELRKHGVSLPVCDEWANYFLKSISEVKTPADVNVLTVPVCYVIKPNTGTVFPVSATDSLESLNKLLARYGPTVLIVDIVGLLRSAMALLQAYDPADDLEESDAGANRDGA